MIPQEGQTFMTSNEVDIIRREAYKRYRLSDYIGTELVTLYNRKYRRTILNMDTLFQALQNASINTMMIDFQGKGFEYQVRTMWTTTVLFSIHGAQLSNIIFLRPNSTLIEVFNPRLNVICYRDIAKMARIQYESIYDTVMEPSSIPTVIAGWQPYINVNVYLNVTDAVRIVQKYVS